MLATLAVCVVLLAVCAAGVGQGGEDQPGEPDKGGQGGAAQALILLLVPLGTLISGTLQVAVLAAFPRFARRCEAAVQRYKWQTPLVGMAGGLAVFLVAALASAVNEQLAGFPIAGGWLLGMVGGVGVSLVAGKWAVERIGGKAPAHPVVQVLAGSFLLGWAMVLLPCVGQILFLVVSWASMGALLMALVMGRKLDVVKRAAISPPPPVSPDPAVPTTVAPPLSVEAEQAPEPAEEPTQAEQSPGESPRGSQTF